ncbi:hypothetical protein CCR85_04880 [Rhodothalassium salexigens]|uniref:DUF58 domain-containing protein n=1 Tax=Rhodothalassium salexigens TaxID=1086 RepID=UPI00191418FA|nr:DUF58 domain-containing protein [Rhodothalassium salexigens]MBK5910826.1 hypothetical protein [Rhodothalassium salexigens]MBK5919483.1 hypothetical protein [Rhodothalassium salexigens]
MTPPIATLRTRLGQRWRPGASGQPPGADAAQAQPFDALLAQAHQLARACPPLNARVSPLGPVVGRGAHGRRRAGPGDSFWQYRGFHEGDRSSDIDWRRSARADGQLYVRQTEWETPQTIWLWCDPSPSMDFAEGGPQTKADRALVLTLALAAMAGEAGEKLGFYTAHRRATGGRLGLDRIARAAESRRGTDQPACPEPAPISRHSHLVLVGDFLGPPADIEAALTRLTAAGVQGHLVQVLDPAEEDFPYRGRVRLTGLEAGDGSEVLDRAEDLRDAYRRRLAAWQQTLARLTGRVGWSFTIHRTDRPALNALLTVAQTMAAARPGGAGHGHSHTRGSR